MMENLISSTNLLPRIKLHMLSYPTHFLKIGGCLIWINFLANRTRQSKTLARRNAFHSSFSISKAKFLHFIGFCCCCSGPFIVKHKKGHEKSPFFKKCHYSSNLLSFSQTV